MEMSVEIASFFVLRIRTAIENGSSGLYSEYYLKALDIALDCMNEVSKEHAMRLGLIKNGSGYEVMRPECDPLLHKESDEHGGWKWETSI